MKWYLFFFFSIVTECWNIKYTMIGITKHINKVDKFVTLFKNTWAWHKWKIVLFLSIIFVNKGNNDNWWKKHEMINSNFNWTNSGWEKYFLVITIKRNKYIIIEIIFIIIIEMINRIISSSLSLLFRMKLIRQYSFVEKI